MNYKEKELVNMEYALIEEEMLELSINQEKEYYDFIRLNEIKSKVLDLIVIEVSKFNNIDVIKNIKSILIESGITNSF